MTESMKPAEISRAREPLKIKTDAPTLSGRELSPKEVKFVSHYCLLMNAGAAVLAAGLISEVNYISHKVSQTGSKLLQDPDIAHAIRGQLDLHAERCAITKERVTGMMLDVYDDAKAVGNLSVAQKAANDVAKLHGLVVTQTKTDFTWRIEDMSEDQITKFLGGRYDPKLVDRFSQDAVDGEIIEQKVISAPQPPEK